MNTTVREILISLSLANLLFIAGWRDLLYPTTFDYHIQTPAGPVHHASLMLSVALAAALMFGGARLMRRVDGEEAKKLTGLVFIVAIFVALNVLRLQFLEPAAAFYTGLGGYALFAAALAAVMTKRREHVFAAARTLMLVLAPFVLVTFSQSLAAVFHSSARAEASPPIAEQLAALDARAQPALKNRVLWIVFDEFDYRAAFELKPRALPEFERLRAESLFATEARSPAYDTLESIPSLLTGKRVGRSTPRGANELELEFLDWTRADFTRAGDVFAGAREMGAASAAVGWYHPYCRLFADRLAACRWEGARYSRDETLLAAMSAHVRDLADHLPLLFSLDPTLVRKGFSKAVNAEFREDARETAETAAQHAARLADLKLIVAAPQIDFAFFHLPFPHAPAQYDPATGDFTVARRDYADNLVLTDRALGELRRAMEAAGVWDATTVIISSDHQWRVNKWKTAEPSNRAALSAADRRLTGEREDERIPFIVKLKGQKTGALYEKPFNTVATRALVEALFKGEAATPEELRDWLDRRAAR